MLPPDFDELPIPDMNDNQSEKNSNNVKSLITSNEEQTLSLENNESDQNLESSILKKIKNN